MVGSPPLLEEMPPSPGTKPNGTGFRADGATTYGAARPPRRSQDGDGACHSLFAVCFPILVLNVAIEVAERAGGDRHKPPLAGAAGKNLDFPDGAFDFGDRLCALAEVVHDLNLSSPDIVGEAIGREVVLAVAGVMEHQFVKLPGLESELVGIELVLLDAILAEIEANFDRILFRKITARVRFLFREITARASGER